VSPTQQLSLAWQSLLATLRSLATPALWIPWLLLGAVQVALAIVIAWFAHPAVSWFAVRLVRLIGGEEALHYPTIFRLLPALHARADLVIGAVVGALAAGAATRMFAARFTGVEARPGAELGWALRHAPALIAINLPLNLLLVGLSLGLDVVLGRPQVGTIVRQAITLVGLGGAMLLQALFLYATPLVAVSGLGIGPALASLPRAFARGAWAALSLALVAVLALLPLQQLAGLGDTLVERGTPEMMAWMTIAQASLGLVVAFVLTGSATLVYQGDVARAVEPRRPRW